MFIVKKNEHSVNNPWLGRIPSMSPEELFGKITQILEHGGEIISFGNPRAGYEHIRRKYPEDVGKMRVYRVIEKPDGLQFEYVPETP